MLTDGDQQVLGEADYIAGISQNVSARLEHFLGVSSEVLYPPLPLGKQYYSANAEPYILSVGRICSIKRVDLIVKAMPQISPGIQLKIAGVADEPGVMDYLKSEIEKHHLGSRIEFLGRVSDEELLALYAHALVVYYAPKDEDYGYVTLEAFASAKPVITASDSVGVLEFVEHNHTGLISEPNSPALAAAVQRLAADPELASQLGATGRRKVEALGLLDSAWDLVCDRLCSPLHQSERKPQEYKNEAGNS